MTSHSSHSRNPSVRVFGVQLRVALSNSSTIATAMAAG